MTQGDYEKKESPPEEQRLKQELDTARTEFSKEARSATNITFRKSVKFLKVGEAFRFKPERKNDEKFLDEYIVKNPDSPVAIAKARYNVAYVAWKQYQYEHKSKEAADKAVRAEVVARINERRMSALQAGFGRFAKEHWKLVLSIALTVFIVALLAVIKVAMIPAAIAAIGTALGLRYLVGPGIRAFLAFAMKTDDPEKVGRYQANAQYGVNWVSLITAAMVGLYVRVYGAEQALVAFGVSPIKAHDIAQARIGAAIGTDQLIGTAEAATLPKAPPTGPEGVITPEEHSYIRSFLKPYRDILLDFEQRIRVLQSGRQSFIDRYMRGYTPGTPEYAYRLDEAKFNFDANREILETFVVKLRNAIRSSETQLEYVARKAFDPKYPDFLADEARSQVPYMDEDVRVLKVQYYHFATYVRTGKFEYVEGALQPTDTPRFRQASYDASAEQPEGVRIGNAEATAAVNSINETMLQPAFERVSALGRAYEALLKNPPPFGTPKHTEWFALASKMEDTLNDYEDLLHRIARLQSHIADLSLKNPKATTAELLEMARADFELSGQEQMGSDRLKVLDDAVRAKGDALIADAKKFGALELVAEKTISVPPLVELIDTSKKLVAYIDAQVEVFKSMADGLARIITARTSIATFRDMMLTEVLAFGKLAPRVQIDLDHAIELVRSGRATSEQITDAYAKADAGMRELNNHAHAAAEHYKRAMVEVHDAEQSPAVIEVAYGTPRPRIIILGVKFFGMNDPLPQDLDRLVPEQMRINQGGGFEWMVGRCGGGSKVLYVGWYVMNGVRYAKVFASPWAASSAGGFQGLELEQLTVSQVEQWVAAQGCGLVS